MILWIDAQLSPHLAPWIADNFEVQAFSVRWLGLRDSKDRQIFSKAREAGAVLLTKDHDFVALVEQHGSPPQVLWITAGNTSNAHLKRLLERSLERALGLLKQGEAVVEVSEVSHLRLVD